MLFSFLFLSIYLFPCFSFYVSFSPFRARLCHICTKWNLDSMITVNTPSLTFFLSCAFICPLFNSHKEVNCPQLEVKSPFFNFFHFWREIWFIFKGITKKTNFWIVWVGLFLFVYMFFFSFLVKWTSTWLNQQISFLFDGQDDERGGLILAMWVRDYQDQPPYSFIFYFSFQCTTTGHRSLPALFFSTSPPVLPFHAHCLLLLFFCMFLTLSCFIPSYSFVLHGHVYVTPVLLLFRVVVWWDQCVVCIIIAQGCPALYLTSIQWAELKEEEIHLFSFVCLTRSYAYSHFMCISLVCLDINY